MAVVLACEVGLMLCWDARREQGAIPSEPDRVLVSVPVLASTLTGTRLRIPRLRSLRGGERRPAENEQGAGKKTRTGRAFATRLEGAALQ